jgi:hypothetical protein
MGNVQQTVKVCIIAKARLVAEQLLIVAEASAV